MENNHSSSSDSLEYTKSCPKKRHAPSFSKNFTLHENIKISRLKQRPRNLPENFNSEFKPMIENLRENLHEGESKQSKGQ